MGCSWDQVVGVSGRRYLSTASTRRWSSGDSCSPSFRKICRTFASTVLGLTNRHLTDRAVGSPFGHERQHLSLSLRQLVKRTVMARALHEARDDRRVDDALTLVDSLECVSEDPDVGDAILEQVTDPLGSLLEQPHRVARLKVLGEHEGADGRVVPAYLLGGGYSLVRVRRRHLDVDDCDVRVAGAAPAAGAVRRSRPLPPRRSLRRRGGATAPPEGASNRRQQLFAWDLNADSDSTAGGLHDVEAPVQRADTILEVDQGLAALARPRRRP